MPYSTQLFPEITVGLDLGDRKTHLTKVDVNGEALERGEVAMTPQAMEKLFQGLPKGARVVMEAGGQSPWVSWLAVEAGHEVLVANTRQSGKNRKKTDTLDADGLARKGRNNPEELHPIDHRSKEVFLDRVVLRARDELVGCRTKLINGIRSTVKVFGYRLRSSSAHGFNEGLLGDLPERLVLMFKPIFENLTKLNESIRKYDKAIDALCEKKYKETEKLRQIKGVGAITALAFVLAIEDAQRFEKSRLVGSYFGLAPRVQQSGSCDPQLGISRAGNGMVRRLLVGSAHYILGPFGPDCDLRRFGKALAKRGGKNAKKRAAVAVARKLAVLLHRLWVTGEPYDPSRNDARKRKANELSV